MEFENFLGQLFEFLCWKAKFESALFSRVQSDELTVYIRTALLFNHIYFQHGRFSYIIDQFDHQNIYKILGAILV